MMTKSNLLVFLTFLTLIGVVVGLPLHPQGLGQVNQYGLDMQLQGQTFLDLDGDSYNDSIFFAFQAVVAPASTSITITVDYAEMGFDYWENWNTRTYSIVTDSSGNAWFNITISANASTRIYLYFSFNDDLGNWDYYYGEYYLDGLNVPYIPPVNFSVSLLNTSTSDTDFDGYMDTVSWNFSVYDVEMANTSFFKVYILWYANLGNRWWDSTQKLYFATGYLTNNSGYLSFSMRFNETGNYDVSFYFIDAWNRTAGEYYYNAGRMDGYNVPWVPYDLFASYYPQEFNSTGPTVDSIKIPFDYTLYFLEPVTANFTIRVALYYEEADTSRTYLNGTTQYLSMAGNATYVDYYGSFDVIFPISKSGYYWIEASIYDTDTGTLWMNEAYSLWITQGKDPNAPIAFVTGVSQYLLDVDGNNDHDTFVFDATISSNVSNIDIPIEIYFDIYADIPNVGPVWYYNSTVVTLPSPGSINVRLTFTPNVAGNFTINIYVNDQFEWNNLFNATSYASLTPRTIPTSTVTSSNPSSSNTSTIIDNPPANDSSEEPSVNDTRSDVSSAPTLPLPIPIIPTLLGLFATGTILRKRKI